MASKQIDPSGPYAHGYQDAEVGLPLEGCPYLSAAQRQDYRNGYRAAKLAERSPA